MRICLFLFVFTAYAVTAGDVLASFSGLLTEWEGFRDAVSDPVVRSFAGEYTNGYPRVAAFSGYLGNGKIVGVCRVHDHRGGFPIAKINFNGDGSCVWESLFPDGMIAQMGEGDWSIVRVVGGVQIALNKRGPRLCFTPEGCFERSIIDGSRFVRKDGSSFGMTNNSGEDAQEKEITEWSWMSLNWFCSCHVIMKPDKTICFWYYLFRVDGKTKMVQRGSLPLVKTMFYGTIDPEMRRGGFTQKKDFLLRTEGDLEMIFPESGRENIAEIRGGFRIPDISVELPQIGAACRFAQSIQIGVPVPSCPVNFRKYDWHHLQPTGASLSSPWVDVKNLPKCLSENDL